MSQGGALTLTVPPELVKEIAQQIAVLLRDQDDPDTDAPPSPWLTFEQACAYTGLSRDALYKLTAARAIPVRKRQGGQGLRFRRDELDDWMQSRYPRIDRLG